MTSYLLNRITSDLFRIYPEDGTGPGVEFEDAGLGFRVDDMEQACFSEELTPTPAATSDEQADQGGSDSLTPPLGAGGGKGIATPGQAWPVDCPNATARRTR